VSSGTPEEPTDQVTQGVVVVVCREGRFLVIRRAAGVVAPGAWCFVGGALQPGETQQQAVVREFAEEVGGRVTPQRKIWEYTRPDRKLLLHWWLADLVERSLRRNGQEVAEIRWCTPDDVEALPDLLPSNRQFLTQVGRGLACGLSREASRPIIQ
jgi:8-oxo-dGTP diphosphatase